MIDQKDKSNLEMNLELDTYFWEHSNNENERETYLHLFLNHSKKYIDLTGKNYTLIRERRKSNEKH